MQHWGSGYPRVRVTLTLTLDAAQAEDFTQVGKVFETVFDKLTNRGQARKDMMKMKMKKSKINLLSF